MEKVIAELHFDKNTYYSLVIRDNKIFSKCFHLNENFRESFIEERSGAIWFYITLKSVY